MTLSFSKEKTGALKALLSIFIVLGHLYYFSDSPIFILFHKLAATAVSLFFFISGFGLVKSWKNKGTGGMTISELLRRLVVQGLAYPPEYWFIFVILFDYLLFWFAFKVLPASVRLPFLFFGSLVFIFFSVWAGYDRCWWICSFSFPCGAVYAMHEDPINSFCGKTVPVYLSCLVVLFLTGIGIYLTGNPFVWRLCY